MPWFVKLDGREHGPWESEELKAGVMVGQVTKETLLHNGNGKWAKAEKVKGLFPEPVKEEVTERLWPCPYCKGLIPEGVIRCRHCTEIVDLQARKDAEYMARPKQWSPGVAALLSFFFPGVGQMYRGQVAFGLCLFFLTIFGYVLFILPGVVIHLVAIFAAAIGDPYEEKF